MEPIVIAQFIIDTVAALQGVAKRFHAKHQSGNGSHKLN